MKHMKKIAVMLAVVIVLMSAGMFAGAIRANAASDAPAAAAEAEAGGGDIGLKAVGAAIAIGLAGLGGTIGMGMAIAKSNEGVARQPEASGKIQTQLMLGLVFIETVVIYALIVAILIVFVL